MARKKRYKVAPGQSILIRTAAGQRAILPGTFVTDDTPGLQHLIASKHVIVVGANPDEDEPDEILKPDLNEKGELETAGAVELSGKPKTDDEGKADDGVVALSGGKLVDPPKKDEKPKPPKAKGDKPAPGAPVVSEKKWPLDPKALEKKTLPELNVMIRERDETVKPFTDRNEAISHLSSDFVKA